jgi:hypothetical protein
MQALLGLHLLMAGKLTSASKIFLEIEFQTSTAAALSYVMRGVTYFIRGSIVLGFSRYAL